jgi:hypothetical protein
MHNFYCCLLSLRLILFCLLQSIISSLWILVVYSTKISNRALYSLCSRGWKRVATAMRMSITCQHCSMSVVLRIMTCFIWTYHCRYFLLKLRAHICINQMMDPAGIANWSVTYVDWSEGKWHPRSFRAKDVTYELLKNMTVCVPFWYHLTLDDHLFNFLWGCF